jgi:hypothetical protein
VNWTPRKLPFAKGRYRDTPAPQPVRGIDRIGH